MILSQMLSGFTEVLMNVGYVFHPRAQETEQE